MSAKLLLLPNEEAVFRAPNPACVSLAPALMSLCTPPWLLKLGLRLLR
jgi:hypothetical protein